MTDLITIQTRIRFITPFQILPWQQEKKRNSHPQYQRFTACANWHNGHAEKRPYIRGTLLRSAAIRQLETLLAIWGNNISGDICSGRAYYDRELSNSRPSSFIRRRKRFDFGNKPGPCTGWEEACPFCRFLGVFDGSRFPENGYDPSQKENKTLNFSNFRAEHCFEEMEDAGEFRIKNRNDVFTKKARDYFTIFEGYPDRCGDFFGEITINPDFFPEGKESEIEKIKQFLGVSLSRVITLSGGACRVDMGEKTGENRWDYSIHQELITGFFRDFLDQSPDNAESDDAYMISPVQSDQDTFIPEIETLCDDIYKKIMKTGNQALIRRYADALFGLKFLSLEEMENLKTRHPQTEKETFWGMKPGRETIKKRIVSLFQDKSPEEHVFLAEALGNRLYMKVKQVDAMTLRTPRVIGENEYYAKPAKTDPGDRKVPAKGHFKESAEWIITGYLEAQTPFYFGKGETKDTQNDLVILKDRNGDLRLPHDTLRGKLNQDLRDIVSGCSMEIGTTVPCECPSCRVMSHVKTHDSIACGTRDTGETRTRNRISPETGTVDDASLFNMELGDKGTRFPFILRYTSHDRAPTLKKAPLGKVLSLWEGGNLWLGGNSATGKGRFRLTDIHCHTIETNSRRTGDWAMILKNRSWIDLSKPEIDEKLSSYEITEAIPDGFRAGSGYQKIAYTLFFRAPVITNDPLAAMFHPECPDAVMYKKRILGYDDSGNIKKTNVYALKGEGIRGVLRYLLGKHAGCHDLDHEDCNCLICEIFGNCQKRGRVRFEDADLISDAEVIRLDHVAIDWNGGTKNHAKFDDYPLPGSPNKELKFQGLVWVDDTLDDEGKKALHQAFADLANNMAGLGGNSGWGYGWVSGIEFDHAPNLVSDAKTIAGTAASGQPVESANLDIKRSFTPEKGHYNPYYYIRPESLVTRDPSPPTHDRYHENLLTGRIDCELTTLSPVFMPDTKENSDFKKDFFRDHPNTPEKHKVFPFFRINGDVMISGSEIRGMITSVYQIATNSCFKNLDPKEYITRRMSANEGGNIPCGVVIMENGKLCVRECESFRLPLYDDLETTKSFRVETPQAEHYKKMDMGNNKKKGKKKNNSSQDNDAMEKALEEIHGKNEIMAEYAKKNRDYLDKLSPEEREAVISGREMVSFKEVPGWENDADHLMVLCDEGDRKGYLKFTGLNNAQKKNNSSDKKTHSHPGTEDLSPPESVKNLLSGKDPVYRPGPNRKKNYKYPRPALYAKDKHAKYTLTKRCERIFEPKENIFSLSETTKRQYKDVIQAYADNTGKIPKVFRTVVQNKELTEGDLVYFESHEKQATNLVPVPISRKTDPFAMGRRFRKGFESLIPCEGECPGNCETCDEDCFLDFFKDYPKGLCPGCSLFGTTHYRGRVRFGFAHLTSNQAIWYGRDKNFQGGSGAPLTLPLLERPRATWPMPHYAAPIPGRKMYIHHPNTASLKEAAPTENNTTIEPLGPENRFSFCVHFENLEKWELGMLLYVLELQKNLAHKIGMGKPLGMGSVAIRANHVLLRDTAGKLSGNGKKEEYLSHGKKEMGKRFGKDWEKISHIKDMEKAMELPESNHGAKIGYIGMDEQEGHKAHEKYKQKWSWEERQAIYSTPWHRLDAEELQESASAFAKELQVRLFGKVIQAKENQNQKKGKIKTDTGKNFEYYIKNAPNNGKNYPNLKKGERISFLIVEDKTSRGVSLIADDIQKVSKQDK